MVGLVVRRIFWTLYSTVYFYPFSRKGHMFMTGLNVMLSVWCGVMLIKWSLLSVRGFIHLMYSLFVDM